MSTPTPRMSKEQIMCRMNAKLQKLNSKPLNRIGELNRRGRTRTKSLLGHLHPLVRERALIYLAKLLSKRTYKTFGIACAIATSMAMRELGLLRPWREQSFMGWRANQYKTGLRTRLGLKDPEPRYPSNKNDTKLDKVGNLRVTPGEANG